MIKLGTPTNLDDYIKVTDKEKIIELNKNGFLICYRDMHGSGVYFKKNSNILNYLNNKKLVQYD